MNETHEQFDDFEEQLRELVPTDVSATARQAMIDGSIEASTESPTETTTETADENDDNVNASRSLKVPWLYRSGLAVAACLWIGVLIWMNVTAEKGGNVYVLPAPVEVQINGNYNSDWTIHAVANAQITHSSLEGVVLKAGEVRIESRSLDKPAQPLLIKTPDSEIELSDAGYYVVSHTLTTTSSESPPDLNPDSTPASPPDSKGKPMKSMTKVLILAGVATLTNTFGGIGGSSDTLLAAEKDKAPVAHVVKANSDFTFDLYKQLAKENAGKNLFLSPYSITSALAMTVEGARGNTAKQMGDVLRFPKIAQRDNAAQPWDTSVIHSGLGGLNQRYNAANKSYELAIANAIWVEQTFPLRAAFTAALSKPYGVKMVNPVDYKSNADGERLRINSWVADKTKDRIKDLLPENSLNTDTRVVLTNAIYFKGDWATKFKKSDTTDRSFTLADGKSVKAPIMFLSEKEFQFVALKADGTPDKSGFGPRDKNGFAIIELPYKGKDLSMIAIAPNSPKGLAGVEAQLNQANVNKWIGRMHREEVNVLLPKFKMTIEYNLNDTLMTMGMKDAFEGGIADFTGVSDSPEASKLCISLVMHKAFVDVNEEGTEAAAATAVVLEIESESARFVPTFNADRPFLYLIRDNKTGTILFIGRVMNPVE